MTQYSYKTHMEDPQKFSKIDVVLTLQLLRGNTKETSNQYLNTTRDILYAHTHTHMYVHTYIVG